MMVKSAQSGEGGGMQKVLINICTQKFDTDFDSVE
jgi:hypothetical protein